MRIDLNSRYSTVDRLRVESNPKLLAALVFEWLEHLKAPILTKEELSAIVVRGERPEVCFRKFDVVSISFFACVRFNSKLQYCGPQSAAHTVEYFVRFVARMKAVGPDVQMELIRRFAASLTHQSVTVRGLLQPRGLF